MSKIQEKLNEKLFNVVLSDKDSDEVKLKKVKYLIRLGADVNAKLYGKSILSWAVIDGNIEPSIIAFLKEKGVEEFEISKEEADRLAQGFWDENGYIKSVEEIKSLVRVGANLGANIDDADSNIWQYLCCDEMNEILKILPKGYEIDGDVVLSGKNLSELPDFSKVKVRGEFDCYSNQLTTLKGAPSEVGGDFNCCLNSLTNLEGGPFEVGGCFNCSNNNLTSLQGGPKKVGMTFRCFNNQLITLEGGPFEVGYGFDCSSNKLTSLLGAPQKVGGWFCCSENQLTSLEGAPKKVKGDFICESNQFVSLKGMPKKIGGSLVIEKEVLDKIRSNETKSFGDIWGRLFGGR